MDFTISPGCSPCQHLFCVCGYAQKRAAAAILLTAAALISPLQGTVPFLMCKMSHGDNDEPPDSRSFTFYSVFLFCFSITRPSDFSFSLAFASSCLRSSRSAFSIFLISLLRALLYRSSRLFCLCFGIIHI